MAYRLRYALIASATVHHLASVSAGYIGRLRMRFHVNPRFAATTRRAATARSIAGCWWVRHGVVHAGLDALFFQRPPRPPRDVVTVEADHEHVIDRFGFARLSSGGKVTPFTPPARRRYQLAARRRPSSGHRAL
jgi:hypothetical protein